MLSYHSGEDRIAKDRFRQATGACDCPPGLPCVCGAVQTVRLVRRVPKRASEAERAANPRAASARLRVAERTEPLTGDDRGRPLTMAATVPVRRVDAPEAGPPRRRRAARREHPGGGDRRAGAQARPADRAASRASPTTRRSCSASSSSC